jgi:hypothetical protein
MSGSISIGHPISATGCILTVKALYELERTSGRYALVTMCIGGGQGIAAISSGLENAVHETDRPPVQLARWRSQATLRR